MADRRRRGKTFVRWVLTLAIVAIAVGENLDDSGEPSAPQLPAGGSAAELRITGISDADVNPGDAIVVKVRGAVEGVPIDATIAKQPADVLVRERDSLVVRIPSDTKLGKAALRLEQGDRRSKAWDLHVRPTNYRKLIARLLGGLALFVYGLGLLASGLRGLTGQRMRSLLGRLTRSPPKAVGVGVLVGAATQLTSSAAALAVSLVEARLLALAPAVGILVGAQLGASITGALLPLAFTRESLLVIAAGVLWTRLADGRRAHAVAGLVLGIGLMLYGAHLLQTSVDPLVSDPKLLPYVDRLRSDGVFAMIACAGTGALLAFVLQGPGPVYVLVVGLVHVSDALPLANALAILAGTNLGAAVGIALVAWQSGPGTRPLAAPQLLFGAAATLVALATLPLWSTLSGSVLVAAGMPVQLAVGFALSQVFVTAGWLLALPQLSARVKKRPPASAAVPAPKPGTLAITAQRELATSLGHQALATEIALETASTADRARAAESEEALVVARRAIERQFTLLGDRGAMADLDRLAATVVAALQLQRVVEQLAHLAELGVERGLRLASDEQARLQAMYALARESFTALIDALEQGTTPDLEAAGAREIRMNQLEAEGRTSAISAPTKHDTSSIRLGISELIDGFEHVGNHLFRVAKTLGEDGDALG